MVRVLAKDDNSNLVKRSQLKGTKYLERTERSVVTIRKRKKVQRDT